MTIRCGWCSKIKGFKEPLSDESETTTICYFCLLKIRIKRFLKELVG